MTIELKPEHERTIELALKSGAYHNREEVLDQAFDSLRVYRSETRPLQIVAILHGRQDLERRIADRQLP